MLALSNLATPFHALHAFSIYYPNSQVTHILEKFYRLYPFILSFAFIVYLSGVLQAFGMHINLKYYCVEYSSFLNSIKQTINSQSFVKIATRLPSAPFFEINMFIYSFTRML